ncbi:MAG: MgtC/SapB family protein [bacterium]|tara:strand:+ start:3611 stop:4336 length:726 start_codon:yes stop_codon:yes gene_type:complete
MQKVHIELLGEVSVYLGLGIEIVTSFVLGGLIGYDREKKMKAAGIKTNMLICIGATLYTAVSLLAKNDASGYVDASRIPAQIVSGIGFLGAGAIIQGRGGVVGLTTAATIWVVAAIGVTVGSGYPLIAAIFTITSLIVLKLLGPLYKLFEMERDNCHYRLEILSKGRVTESVKELILNETNTIEEMSEEIIDIENNERILTIYLTVHPRKIRELVDSINTIVQVEKVHFHLSDHHAEVIDS